MIGTIHNSHFIDLLKYGTNRHQEALILFNVVISFTRIAVLAGVLDADFFQMDVRVV